MFPQQRHEEAAARFWAGRTEVLDAGPGLEEWTVKCPPALRQRPRSTLWKAFLNSRLKQG